MKSLFPNLEVYKDDADVGSGDVPRKLVRELAELFKSYGLSIRLDISNLHEREAQE